MTELLIVIAIIGILLAFAVVALNNARAKSRDSKRVSDIQIVRAALEQHWIQNASYPAAASFQNMGTGAFTTLSSNGFQTSPGTGVIYLPVVPTGPRVNEYYQYRSTVTTGYAISFITELPTTFGAAGTYYAHGNGDVDTDSSSK